uniref:Uncharacterized protein n=1 Tax=Parascaris univalens TaxID=6257 RepID=A0A914ZIG2_PARUN
RIRSQSADSSMPIADNDNKFDELIVGANTTLYNRSALTDFQGSWHNDSEMRSEQQSKELMNITDQCQIDPMVNITDLLFQLFKETVDDFNKHEPLDVGELLQRESKALMDCGRNDEVFQLLRIVEPLGDLLRRVQMLRKEEIDPKVTCDSYISSSPEFHDSTEMPTTGNRNKENENVPEVDADALTTNMGGAESEPLLTSGTNDPGGSTDMSTVDSGTSSGSEHNVLTTKAVVRRPLFKRHFDNTDETAHLIPATDREEAPKRSRRCMPSVMSEPVLSVTKEETVHVDVFRDHELPSSTSLTSLTSVKSVSFDLDSSKVRIFEKTSDRTFADSMPNTACILNVSLSEFKELFPSGSAKMPEDSSYRQSREPEKFIYVKKGVRRLSKKALLLRLQTDFKVLDDALSSELFLKNWLITDSVLEVMNEKCFLDPTYGQGSLISRVHYPQIDPQDILDSLRELNTLPCGMVVYVAIGYDWATERETFIKFGNTYRHIISTLKRMLLAGYMSAVQMQAKSAEEYDLQMETKKGAKKRSLHRGGRMWLSPPRLFLVTIPSDDNDEITRSRCEAMNELMISLATNPYDCFSSSSGDEEFESDPYMVVKRVEVELLDWRKMCEEKGVKTQKDRISVLMEYLRLERGVLMKPANR